MNFRVTPEEYELIERRQAQSGIKNTRAYLLKQAVDGRVIIVEHDSVKECTRLLGNVSNNINPIARRANESGNVYGTDLEDIKVQQDEIWGLFSHHQTLLAKTVLPLFA